MKQNSLPSHKNYFGYLFFVILILLSFSTLKVGGIRFSQLLLILTAFLFLANDYSIKKNDYSILLFMLFGAIGMTLVSLNSSFGKVGEIKFIIKYFLIFPATFYVGAKMIQKVGIKKLAFIFEIVAFIYALVAYMIAFLPIPESILNLIVHYRTGFGGSQYLDFQGTFFEAGWFALATVSMLVAAFLIRYEFKIWPKKRIYLLFLYLFVSVALLLSKNKTIWVALILIGFILIVLKTVMLLIYSNQYKYDHKHPIIKRLSAINPIKTTLAILFTIFLLVGINELLTEPIFSTAMLEEKLEHERGKAFSVVLKLLEDSSWLGGYGFGFVEYYFSTMPFEIMGLGEGSGMVFNSYLDIWLSASLLGLIFHILILIFSISGRYYFTLVLPLLYFIFANFNPAIGDEYYYLFLGLSYGIIQKYVKKRESYA